MGNSHILFVLILLLSSFTHTYTDEHHHRTRFVLSWGSVLLSTVLVYWNFETPSQEGCFIRSKAKSLGLQFQEKLFGQHLVQMIVPKVINVHLKKKNHKKALVMSFHGWTGSGKNYAAKILADTVYISGSKSEFVHWYIGSRDFPHLTEVNKYREKLRREVTEFTKQCGHSLFIFDEMDKMVPGVIDSIKPYLDFYDEIDGVDYRQNIFLFLSNAGGNQITRIALNTWMEGNERESIDMKQIEQQINLGAFNEIGGLYHSDIVKKNLVDVYVPFLPLEKNHVKQCIEYELQIRGLNASEDTIKNLAEQLIYYPPEFELFSVSGCKKISLKIDMFENYFD